MKKKLLAMFLVLVLVFALPLSATAATWEGVDDFEKLSTAFGDTDAEVHIILAGDITNETAETLTANIGQTYTIDGKEYTLTDVYLDGGGEVVINADITGSENSDALNTDGEVSVTVNGDIIATEDAIDANDKSTVVVNGDVASTGGDGIDADDEANVTVNGDVYGGDGADGVDASDDTVIVVNGDVYGGDGTAPDADGNLDNKTMNDPDGYSDGGAGIEADENAQVTVDGNVYGGDSYGTYSYAGAGVEAMEQSKVEVTGDAVGGDQIANPDVSAEAIDEDGNSYTSNGYAGDGVYMANTADVTIGGDAIGGTASGQESVGGCGVYIELTLTAEVSRDPETGENVKEEIIPGQITVEGTVVGGQSTAENGTDGCAVYYAIYEDNPVEDNIVPEELIDQVLEKDADYLRYCVEDIMARVVYSAGVNYIDHEKRVMWQEQYKDAVRKLAKEYGVDTETVTDFSDIVAAVPEADLSDFAERAIRLGNELLEDMAMTIYAVPKLTTSGLECVGDGDLVCAPSDELSSYIEKTYIELKDYEGESGSSGGGTGTVVRPSVDVPMTGDDTNIGILSVMLALSAATILVIGIALGRKKYNK